MVGTLDLMRDAQSGDEQAMTRLLMIIRDEHMPRYTTKYRGRNVTVTDDDIESEFMLGAWKAISKARLDLGNPVNFVCWKATKQVVSLFRNRIRKEVRGQCMECGHTGTMGWKAKIQVCAKCKSSEINTWMVTQWDNQSRKDGYDGLIKAATGVTAETAWSLAVYNIEVEELHQRIEEIRERLDGRALDLFDCIVFEGLNRENCTNYIAEIAERWGVRQTAVAAALRRLRRIVTAYLAESQGV